MFLVSCFINAAPMQCGVNYSAARVTGCCRHETLIILKEAMCATSFLCLAIRHN